VPSSGSENVAGLQQLQKSPNISDTESKSEFRRRTAQPFFAIFECHTFLHADETRGYVGHAAGPHEERNEKLSDVTAAINLVADLHLYSVIRLQRFLML
jgi:hypothetical protein